MRGRACYFTRLFARYPKQRERPLIIKHLQTCLKKVTKSGNGDYSNGILLFSASLPVFSFHLYIKVGLWISTELTEFSTRRSSWMKIEKNVIMSWIR